MEREYDVVVIGGGPGGYECAERLAKYGVSTVLIERNAIGGTCLNRGCIPTKTFLHAAGTIDGAKKGAAFGLAFTGMELDRAALLSYKDEVVATLRQGVEKRLQAAGVTVIYGSAYVPAPGIVNVTDNNGESMRLKARDIVAAVGSMPSVPPIPGTELPGVVTSDYILEKLPDVRRLVIIGGGVIGMEIASLYLSLGSEVTVLEGMPRILPSMDREFSQSLSVMMKKRGAKIETNAMVGNIALESDRLSSSEKRVVEDGLAPCGDDTGDCGLPSLENDRGDGEASTSKKDGEKCNLTCSYTVKGKAATATGDLVLIAVGRRTAVREAFAPEIPVEFVKGRAAVDKNMLTSVPHIYVIGDAADGYPQLAHAASAQGLAVAAAIAGKPFGTELSLVPGCVYTQPEIASVGLGEAEAKDAGIAVRVAKYPTSANGKSVLTGQERGFIKLVADESDVLIGAQLMCAHATDMIAELALAIAKKMTVAEAACIIRPHPTFEEAIGEAAQVYADKYSKQPAAPIRYC